MNTSSDFLRIGIFYDGNFLLHASNYYNYIHPQHRRLSLSGIHNYIKIRVAEEEEVTPRWCQVVEAHYFRGRLNAMEASQRGNQLYNDRVFDDIMMAEGIQTHFLPLRNIQGKKEERGIDVWLSLEAYELALHGKIDVAVLIVADTDYVPLLRKLTALGIRTMILSWEFSYTNDDGVRNVTKTSHDLLSIATYPIAVHEEIENGLRQNDPYILDMFVGSDASRIPDEEAEEEIVGHILSVNTSQGYGFIQYPNNNLYFNSQDVLTDFYDLAPGDTVTFHIEKNPNNQQDVAKGISKI